MSLLNCVPCMPAWYTCLSINVPTCQKGANFSFLHVKSVLICHFYVATCQSMCQCANMPKVCLLFNLPWQSAKGVPIFQLRLQKAYQFFNYFSKEFFNFWIFQLRLTFANFKNIWAVLESLFRETQNLNFDICKVTSKKKFINLKLLKLFSTEHVGLTEQLFG